jgi:AraC family transcriptional regulator of adaptative response / DNA-3-methyladenine glycosylase II
MLARDARFDGCFFAGISSTGVYCRPICRVKVPKFEHCTFYATAAGEAAGYRPCLRCRPELAPGNSSFDSGPRIAHSAARLIEEGALNESGMEELAQRLGITSRHLRRVFNNEFGVSPLEFAQTQRLLLAKRLLADSTLSIIDVAFAAGFKSLRRFEAVFRERYRMSPFDLRRRPARHARPGALVFDLSYRPPYDWAALLNFLRTRCIAGVECISDAVYRRTVRIDQSSGPHIGWMEAAPKPQNHSIRVVASASLWQVIPALLARVKCLFDVSCNPAPINDGLGALAAAQPGLRVPGAFDGFEAAARAILGQQVSVAAARTLAGRLAAAIGDRVESPFAELTTAFPTPKQVAALEIVDLTNLGILPARARTIRDLARAVADRSITLAPGAPLTATMDKLRLIPGIGEWTAQYIAMRVLGWPDAFPHTDLGVMRALGERNPKRVLAAAEEWRPWRAYAVMHLWAREGLNGTVR